VACANEQKTRLVEKNNLGGVRFQKGRQEGGGGKKKGLATVGENPMGGGTRTLIEGSMAH